MNCQGVNNNLEAEETAGRLLSRMEIMAARVGMLLMEIEMRRMQEIPWNWSS